MYKIIQDGKVIDVVQYPKFIRFLSSGYIAITDKTSSQGIVGSDGETVYSFKPTTRNDITVVTIVEITLDELNILKTLLSSSQEAGVTEEELIIIKRDKIRQLSNTCKSKIISGFSIVLSDGNLYEFKLSTEDQLNLLSIENQLNSGAESFLYHATEQPCRFFSHADMSKIIKAFRQHTLYHTTYFNWAKQYINSLADVENVNNFVYGDDVSSIVNDSIIKQILRSGGNLA